MYHETAQRERKAVGDAAVDGIIGGLIAGGLMATYLAGYGAAAGHGAAAIMRLFSPGGDQAITGTLLHLGVSSVYGALFGILWNLLFGSSRRVPPWLGGLGYGMILLIFAVNVLLPATNAPLRAIPTTHFGIAHAIYGAMLGWLVSRGR
jgi:hypothetical protein